MDTPTRVSGFVTVNVGRENSVRLHYLDWGGDGPALVFLPGMGCSAFIFNDFAPRFTGRFHVLAMTRWGHGDSDYPENGYDVDTLTEDLRGFLDALGIEKAILAGHSMAGVEITHFAALYLERVIKLVYLDAGFDRTLPILKELEAQSPLRKIETPDINNVYATFKEYATALQNAYRSFSVVWGPLMNEDLAHNVTVSPEGKITDKMSESIGSALNTHLRSYRLEGEAVQAPVLSLYAFPDGEDFIADDYSAELKAEILRFFAEVNPPFKRQVIEKFRELVPQAQIVEIPHGHHYCFIKNEEIVFQEMNRFLNEEFGE